MCSIKRVTVSSESPIETEFLPTVLRIKPRRRRSRLYQPSDVNRQQFPGCNHIGHYLGKCPNPIIENVADEKQD